MDPISTFSFEPDLLRLIFRDCLDLSDLGSCRAICRQWRDFLDSSGVLEEAKKRHLLKCWESAKLESADIGKFKEK